MSSAIAGPVSDPLILARQRTALLAAAWGRRPRILLTPLQHRAVFPVKALAVQLADVGFDVDLFTVPQQPREAARMAIENDVHAIGVPASDEDLACLQAALADGAATDILIVAWAAKGAMDGLPAGVLQLAFGPETKTAESALLILDRLHPSSFILHP